MKKKTVAQGTQGWVYSRQTPLHGDWDDWILVGLGSGLIKGRKDYSRNGAKEVLDTLYLEFLVFGLH